MNDGFPKIPHGGVGSQHMNRKIEIGVWNTLGDIYTTMILAEHFDFVFIDLEHGFRSIDDLTTTLNFYNLARTDYSVRVRSFEDPLIQTLLDMGVRNFILPQLRSIEEFDTFKKKVTFPPNGTRGLHPRSKLSPNIPSSETLTITVIIETVEALDLIQEFANDELVSELYLGVFDLSLELGIQEGPFSERMNKYFDEVRSTCSKTKKRFIAMLPEGSDSSFARTHDLDRVVAGIDCILLNQLYLGFVTNLRST
jgi:2-keto-3-deoxy-L-rhamnonate aldolase RhmA